MMEKEPFENRMNKLAGRLTNIVLLGFFTLVCSLPVFTAGAAFTALYVSMKQYLKYEEDKALRIFFPAFKERFWISTKVFLVHLVLIAIFVWDLLYYRTGNSTIDYIGQAGSFSLLMLSIFELTVVFVVIGEELCENKVLVIIRTALDMAFSCFKESASLLGLTIAAIVICVVLLRPFILVLPGVIAYLHYPIIEKMLERYRFQVNHKQYLKREKK